MCGLCMINYTLVSNTVNWKAYIGQNISLKPEHNYTYDRLSATGETLLKGEIGAVLWVIFQENFLNTLGMLCAKFEATVQGTKIRLSSLIQDRLEIQIKVKVV